MVSVKFIILYLQCSSNFLGKYRSKHDRSTIDPIPDVNHMYRINKVTDRTAELKDAAYEMISKKFETMP